MIHNNGGLDPAIVPATALAAANWWRPGPGLLRADALAIAVPGLFFFNLTALTDPASAKPFLNHLTPFLAAILTIASASLSCRPRPPTRA